MNTNYERKDKIKRIVYKCVNWGKEELFWQNSNQTDFCYATIKYIEPNQHVKSGYFIKKDDSLEYNKMPIKKIWNKT